MLTRYLIELWLQIRYSRLRPDQTTRWYNLEDDPPMEPSYESIIKEVLKDRSLDKGTAASVNSLVSELRRAAHPSSRIVDQNRKTREDDVYISLGGRFDRRWAFLALDRGTFATLILLIELKTDFPQSAEWLAEFDRLTDLRNSHYPVEASL